MLTPVADQKFVERLRRDTGCPQLDILWNAQMKLYEPRLSPGGNILGWRPTGRRGGWMVCHVAQIPVPVDVRGLTVLVHEPVPVPVWRLNGVGLWPLQLGDFIIEQMIKKDRCRNPDTDAMNVEAEQDAQRRLHKEGDEALAAGAEETRHAVRDFVEQWGAPLSTREDHIEVRTRADTQAEALEQDRACELKELAYG